jgi:hypothetical protein
MASWRLAAAPPSSPVLHGAEVSFDVRQPNPVDLLSDGGQPRRSIPQVVHA